MTDEDMFFWGIFKNKLKDKDKDNKIMICPKCGSKNVIRVNAQEPVFIEASIPYKCNDCGYLGKPKAMNSKEK